VPDLAQAKKCIEPSSLLPISTELNASIEAFNSGALNLLPTHTDLHKKLRLRSLISVAHSVSYENLLSQFWSQVGITYQH
jgi:hypothetical protein